MWAHAQVGLAKGYRMFAMPELGAGKDPLESLYAVTGGPTAEVLAMVKDDVAPEPEPPAAAPAAAEEEDEEDGGDLWGDEDDDEEAEAENEKRLAAIAAAHKAKKAAAGKLKVVIAMSKIILDVKPWDDTTDMAELEKLVRGIKHPTNPKAIEWQAGALVSTEPKRPSQQSWRSLALVTNRDGSDGLWCEVSGGHRLWHQEAAHHGAGH